MCYRLIDGSGRLHISIQVTTLLVSVPIEFINKQRRYLLTDKTTSTSNP